MRPSCTLLVSNPRQSACFERAWRPTLTRSTRTWAAASLAPHLNGKVERSHRVDDQEFDRLIDEGGVTDNIHLFNEKLRASRSAWARTSRMFRSTPERTHC